MAPDPACLPRPSPHPSRSQTAFDTADISTWIEFPPCELIHISPEMLAACDSSLKTLAHVLYQAAESAGSKCAALEVDGNLDPEAGEERIRDALNVLSRATAGIREMHRTWVDKFRVCDAGHGAGGGERGGVERGRGRAVFKNPKFSFLLLRTALEDSPQGPPTANRQPPPTANRQPPPTANRQPPPTANRQPPPTANHCSTPLLWFCVVPMS